eukprot:scaffold127673_cov19-Tisochrysis_lutea.AAC.1
MSGFSAKRDGPECVSQASRCTSLLPITTQLKEEAGKINVQQSIPKGHDFRGACTHCAAVAQGRVSKGYAGDLAAYMASLAAPKQQVLDQSHLLCSHFMLFPNPDRMSLHMRVQFLDVIQRHFSFRTPFKHVLRISHQSVSNQVTNMVSSSFKRMQQTLINILPASNFKTCRSAPKLHMQHGDMTSCGNE